MDAEVDVIADTTVDIDVVVIVVTEVVDVDDRIEEDGTTRVSAMWTPPPISQQVVFVPPQHTVPSAHWVI